MNNEEKIKRIKETEKELLTKVKEEIEKENHILNLNITDVIKLLNYDKMQVKKYEAVVNAQNLIIEFTNNIISSNNIEEIKEIRNKLNYYINKIKKEIKDRGLSEDEYNKYYENATNLRKDIAKYIRFIKREDKINEIESLNNNIDNLSSDELTRLKTLLKNEVAYGRRNSSDCNNTKKEEKNKDEIILFNKINKPLKKDFSEELKNSRILQEIKAIPIVKPTKDMTIKVATQDTKKLQTYNTVDQYLEDKIKEFKSTYRLVRTNKYTNNIVKNIPILIKNVPKYIHNKKCIKRMERDFVYYKGAELIGFAAYTKMHNSITHNIKKALEKGLLKKREDMYYNEHIRCVRWIKEFCLNHSLNISYTKTI